MLTAGTREPSRVDYLIWVRSRAWDTGVIHEGGLWTGALARTFTVGGVVRDYQGAGPVIQISPIVYGIGTSAIQSQTVKLNGLAPEVEVLFRAYNPQQADVEIHRWRRPGFTEMGGVIERAFKGKIDSMTFTRDASDTETSVVTYTCTVKLMSSSRAGTRVLHLTRSDASQRLVDPNDEGRKYTASKAKVAWMAEVDDPYRLDQLGGSTIDADDL